jgi:hypothetical protein
MQAVEPRIVERLPSHRARILRACFRDAAVAELCRDYDMLAEAQEGRVARDGLSNERHTELLDLMDDLERELLDRLDRMHTIRQTDD